MTSILTFLKAERTQVWAGPLLCPSPVLGVTGKGVTGREESPGLADGGAWHLVECLQRTFVPSVPGPELDVGRRHIPNTALHGRELPLVGV